MINFWRKAMRTNETILQSVKYILENVEESESANGGKQYHIAYEDARNNKIHHSVSKGFIQTLEYMRDELTKIKDEKKRLKKEGAGK